MFNENKEPKDENSALIQLAKKGKNIEAQISGSPLILMEMLIMTMNSNDFFCNLIKKAGRDIDSFKAFEQKGQGETKESSSSKLDQKAASSQKFIKMLREFFESTKI
ncbi:hypothetical protein KAU11_11980 [Candidatus Babeliales bacterium]|nr:hypothetical protein [Candidatus Babeliales bacterium]